MSPPSFSGAFYNVSLQIRPYTPIPPSQNSKTVPDILIGEPEFTMGGIKDFVFREDAEHLREVWIASLQGTKEVTFYEESDADLSPEDRVIRAAADAADKIDNSFRIERIKRLEYPIPEYYAFKLPFDNPVIRQDAITTQVPFGKLRELLLKRDAESPTSMGFIQLRAVQTKVWRGNQLN